MNSLLSWLTGEPGAKLLWIVLTYFTAMLGAILTYLFASAKGLESTVPRLKQLFPEKTDTFYYRFDFCLVIILGSAVGYIFFEPKNTIQALAAGCGWVGALNVLLQQKPPQSQSLTGNSNSTSVGGQP